MILGGFLVASNSQPLFLFSLPRSGSTLLQRILASHKDIATVSEPWILLPYLYTMKKNGMYAEYGHRNLVDAVEDFCRELPNGKDDYLCEMREFVLSLYDKANKNNAKYFLDKTPRYHLVVEDIIHLFPEGKFIVLLRNPLSVVASIMETWANGKWNINAYKVDLFDGLNNLVTVCKKYTNRICIVRYEDILANPEHELQRIFKYLDLLFDPEMLLHFNKTQLKGKMGDPTGTNLYRLVSKEPLEKWKSTLANPIRREWCRRYLRQIGYEHLKIIGYDMDTLLEDVNASPFNFHFIISDVLQNIYDFTYRAIEFPTIALNIFLSACGLPICLRPSQRKATYGF